LSAECVALIDIAGCQSTIEPVNTLFGSAVGKGIRDDGALGSFLLSVVADGARRI